MIVDWVRGTGVGNGTGAGTGKGPDRDKSSGTRTMRHYQIYCCSKMGRPKTTNNGNQKKGCC